MSTLLERKIVHCPHKRACEYLEGLLHDSAETKAAIVTRLEVPIHPEDGPMLHKDVTITYGVGVDPMHFDEPWVVHWEPLNGGPYPTFDGTLTVCADETYRTCLLELSGEYQPPLGAAGVAFDSIIGSRIASAT